MFNIEIRLIIFFAAKDGKALYIQQKQDRELTGSDHELCIAKFRLIEESEENHKTIQFSSVAQSCPILCDPMDYSMQGFCVHH